MSDGVKRYDLSVSGTTPVVTINDRGAHVSASDHDRIVAELRAEVEKFKRSEIVNAIKGGQDYGDALDEIANLKQAIAKQARKLDLARVLYHAAIKIIDRYSKEKFPLNQTHTIEDVMDRYDKELAAIEKEGAKDE